MRSPNFRTGAVHLDEAMMALGRAAAQLRVDGAEKQHPFYYRCNQFWRQVEEFRNETRRAASDAIPRRRLG